MSADRDPLAVLVDALGARQAVPFEWAVEHGRDDDSVRRAWAASRTVYSVVYVSTVGLDTEAGFRGVARVLIDARPRCRLAIRTAEILRENAIDEGVRELVRQAYLGHQWVAQSAFYRLAVGYTLGGSTPRAHLACAEFFANAAHIVCDGVGSGRVLESVRRHLPPPTFATLAEACRVG